MSSLPIDSIDVASMSLAQLKAEAARRSPSRSSVWLAMRSAPLLRSTVLSLRALDAVALLPLASPDETIRPSTLASVQASVSSVRSEIAGLQRSRSVVDPAIAEAQAELDAATAELRQLQFQCEMDASSPPPLLPLPSPLARPRPLSMPIRLAFKQRPRRLPAQVAATRSLVPAQAAAASCLVPPPSPMEAEIAQLRAQLEIAQLQAALAAARLPGPSSHPPPNPSFLPPLGFGRGQFAGTTSAPAGDYDIESGVASDDDDFSTVSAMGPHAHSSPKVQPSHASAAALQKQVLDRASHHEQLSVPLLATFVSSKNGFEFLGADFEAYNYRRSNAARRGQEMSSEISKSGNPQTAVTVGPWQSLGELEVFAAEQTTLAISSPALHDHAALQTALMHLQPFFMKVTATYISVIGPQGMVVNGRPCQWSDHAELLAGFLDLWLFAMASRDFSLLSTGFPAAMASIYLRLSSNNGLHMRLGLTWRQVMLLSGHQCGSRSCGSNNGCCDEVCITCAKPRLEALGTTST
jgi:hypothetical protein